MASSSKDKLFHFDDWSVWEVRGDDSLRFLQGQLTNDVEKLKKYGFQTQCRLNRQGRLESYAYLAKSEDSYFLFGPKDLVSILVEDLNKFIIADDVDFVSCDASVYCRFAPYKSSKGQTFVGILYDQEVTIELSTEVLSVKRFKEVSDQLREMLFFSGWPEWNKSASPGQLINETYFNQIAISYDKGCFLGQETAAKIESRRGASQYPTLIKMEKKIETSYGQKIILEKGSRATVLDQYNEESETWLKVFMNRDLRVNQRVVHLEWEGQHLKGVIEFLPRGGVKTFQEQAQTYYQVAIDLFEEGQDEESIRNLRQAIFLNPNHADSYEMLAVILGRHEKYQEAIELLDKLQEVDPSSIMAHTNKSLFYMKIGEIELAEEEKSLATVKNFERLGREAQAKKQQEEQETKNLQQLESRESMYKEVLSIDPNDAMACLGLGEISFERNLFQEAKDYAEKVLKADSEYSTAYLLLGKACEKLGLKDEALKTLERGIEVASKKGELMPANKMQSILNRVSIS